MSARVCVCVYAYVFVHLISGVWNVIKVSASFWQFNFDCTIKKASKVFANAPNGNNTTNNFDKKMKEAKCAD